MSYGASELNSHEATLPMKLAIAREALADGRRAWLPGSAQWRAAQALIEDIDALMPHLRPRPALGFPLNLNAGSGLPVKGRTIGSREGAFREWAPEGGSMKKKPVADIAAEIRRKRRIGKYDVQALRETFRKGFADRADADLLIALDQEVDTVHFSWPAFFIGLLTEFAVWNSGEAGYIDADKSKWLLGSLAHEGATERATRALVSIAREAQCFDEAFFAEPPATVGPATRAPLELAA